MQRVLGEAVGQRGFLRGWRAMQRLHAGVSPTRALHQDRCGTLRSHTDPCAMSDCRQNPHSRSASRQGRCFLYLC
ncbi:MAG: hypothetical protein F6K55_33330 [Moorea sp. SIO4A3]|nr:hypothetical protein [Moorena sp. SIO4A3]